MGKSVGRKISRRGVAMKKPRPRKSTNKSLCYNISGVEGAMGIRPGLKGTLNQESRGKIEDLL